MLVQTINASSPIRAGKKFYREYHCADDWLGCNARFCDRRSVEKGVLIVKSE